VAEEARTVGAVITATVGKQVALPLVAAPPYSHKCSELTVFSIEANLFGVFVIVTPHIVN
jgi:hypothetical protein